MPARTAKGTAMLRRVRGFRTVIETAETHMSRWAEEENVFPRFLPYAIVFGLHREVGEGVRGARRASRTPPGTCRPGRSSTRTSRTRWTGSRSRAAGCSPRCRRPPDRAGSAAAASPGAAAAAVAADRGDPGLSCGPAPRGPVAWVPYADHLLRGRTGLPSPRLGRARHGRPRGHVLPHARVPEALLGGVRGDSPSTSCSRSPRRTTARRSAPSRSSGSTRPCGSSAAPRSPTTWARSASRSARTRSRRSSGRRS